MFSQVVPRRLLRRAAEAGATQLPRQVPPGGADPARAAGGGLGHLRVHRQQHRRVRPRQGGAHRHVPPGDEGEAEESDRGPGQGGLLRVRRLGAPGQGDTLAQEREEGGPGAQVRHVLVAFFRTGKYTFLTKYYYA